MKATQVYKMQNADGTFTYTNENGEVLIAKSKKDFEYAAPAHQGRGLAFGKFTTCLKAIDELKKRALWNEKWMRDHEAYWTAKYGAENFREEMKKAMAWARDVMLAKPIKIETIQ